MTTSTADRGQPWGRACGLLGGCATTLAGVVQQVDPDVIVFRATVAAIAIGAVVGLFRAVVQALPAHERDEE